MISDTLFNAIQEIRQYQKELPLVYGEIKDDIDKVTEVMEAMQLKLDDPNYMGIRYQPKRKKTKIKGGKTR